MQKNSIRFSVSLVTSLFLLAACAAKSPAPPSAGTRTQAATGSPNLTRAEAELRAKQITDVQYRLAIDLMQPDSFSGEESIKLAWTHIAATCLLSASVYPVWWKWRSSVGAGKVYGDGMFRKHASGAMRLTGKFVAVLVFLESMTLTYHDHAS